MTTTWWEEPLKIRLSSIKLKMVGAQWLSEWGHGGLSLCSDLSLPEICTLQLYEPPD